jgi:hypothetical protein
MIGEDSLLERVTAAAEERPSFAQFTPRLPANLAQNHRVAAAEGLVLETLPLERVGEFYEEATRGRSASHHLKVKAALALLLSRPLPPCIDGVGHFLSSYPMR